jgi:hypothetical protein
MKVMEYWYAAKKSKLPSRFYFPRNAYHFFASKARGFLGVRYPHSAKKGIRE